VCVGGGGGIHAHTEACGQATGKGGHRLLLAADPSNLTVIFRPTFTFAAALDAVATGQAGSVVQRSSRTCPYTRALMSLRVYVCIYVCVCVCVCIRVRLC
jgi:hypothetical protein